MHIEWGSLAQIFLVSFGAAVGVIALFALGVAALASSPPSPSRHIGQVSLGARHVVAALCFFACALMVCYGLYVIITA